MRSLTQHPRAVLFASGLAIRLATWLASPESALPWSAVYQGDAPYWQATARGELGVEGMLPFRPPAMGWLASAVWDGDPLDAWLPRLLMVFLGALVGPMVFAGAATTFSRRTAWIAGWICVASSSLLALGSGVHGDLPYLLLFLGTVPDLARLCRQPTPMVAARWSSLHAAACLFRVDHIACWALSMLCLLRPGQPRRVPTALVAIACFAVALAPWQWRAAHLVTTYNAQGNGGPIPAGPLPGSLPWDPAAVAAINDMPAFARAATFGFVDATVRARGRARVGVADLAVLDEAYGTRPAPLRTPLLALYGPLNFFLGNSPESDGTFTRAPLDRPPQLLGGAARYPQGLLQALPRNGALELSYPPHLQAVNDGYRLGMEWLAANPWRGCQLLGLRLVQWWRGAATGIGTGNFPMGRSGVREPVDVTVAEGVLADVWRIALLLAAACGLWRARSNPGLWLWLSWLLSKALAAAMFFGYARLGTLCVPVCAVLWANAAEAVGPTRRAVRLVLLGLACIALFEATQIRARPQITAPDQIPGARSLAAPFHGRAHVAYD